MFRCIEYAHIPDEKRVKLDDKGKKYVFLRISEQSKAYKLFNPMTGKIVINRDVIFDELNTWNWTEDTLKQQTVPMNFEDNDESLTPQLENPVQQSVELELCKLFKITTRRRPTWMDDYEVSGDLSNEALVHYALL